MRSSRSFDADTQRHCAARRRLPRTVRGVMWLRAGQLATGHRVMIGGLVQTFLRLPWKRTRKAKGAEPVHSFKWPAKAEDGGFERASAGAAVV